MRSWDQKSKKHYFWLSISLKMPRSEDRIIITTFDLMKNQKLRQSHDWKNFQPEPKPKLKDRAYWNQNQKLKLRLKVKFLFVKRGTFHICLTKKVPSVSFQRQLTSVTECPGLLLLFFYIFRSLKCTQTDLSYTFFNIQIGVWTVPANVLPAKMTSWAAEMNAYTF